MKYTLLDLTQAVLSSMDSDEINSIGDSSESLQVVEVIKTVYDDIISRTDLSGNKVLFNLVASTDPSRPTLMRKPSNIDRIEWLKYDIANTHDVTPNWNTLTFLPVQDFVDYVHSYNTTDTDVSYFDYTTDTFTFRFTYKTDTHPHYYTSFDDQTLVFDAYDSGIENTLQSSKTLGFGTKITSFIKEDNFVPNLQPQQFALLLNEAKSLAWTELKQSPHPKAEQSARRNWRHAQKTRQNITDGTHLNSNTHSFDKLPNFSRRRR